MDDQIQKTTLIAVYSAGVAACYLAGFWGRFDVNIFQFAGLAGFASMALYPLMTALGLNFLAAVLLGSGPAKQTTLRQEARKDSFGVRLFRIVNPIWLALTPGASIALVILVTHPFKWMLLLFLLIPWISWLNGTPLARHFIPDARVRSYLVYWLVACPALAVLAGALNAQTLVDGNETRTVAPTGAAKDLQWDEQHPIAYLGFAGGTFFLFESKTGNVVMVNQAVAAPLTIQPRQVKPTPLPIPKWLSGLLQR